MNFGPAHGIEKEVTQRLLSAEYIQVRQQNTFNSLSLHAKHTVRGN